MRRLLWAALLAAAFGASEAVAQPANAVTRPQILTNNWNLAGTWDFDSGKLRVDRGTCPPAASFCDASDDAGSVYVCTDSPGDVYVCPAAGAPTQAAGGGSPIDCGADNIFCVSHQPGDEYSVICGATPMTTQTSACAAGSAIKAAKDSGLCSLASPCTVAVLPDGVYDEVVSIDNVKGLHLVAIFGRPLVMPTVTAGVGVNGGVLRIGNATSTDFSTDGILVDGFRFWNNAFNPPEAGCQLTKETAGAGVPDVAGVTIRNTDCVGEHDGIQWHLGAGPDVQDQAFFRIENVYALSGADACTEKGTGRVFTKGLTCHQRTNFCVDASQAASLDAMGGTVQSGSAAAQTVTLASSQAPAINDFLVGRAIDLYDADGTGGGTCGATNNAVGRYQITDWDGTSKVAALLFPGTITGTAASGSTSTTLVFGSSPMTTMPDDLPNGRLVTMTTGPCSGQSRKILDFTDTSPSNTATVSAWTACTPGSSNVYSVSGYLVEDPTTGCAYAIQPSFDWRSSPCQNRHGAIDRATGTSGGQWKGAMHWGATGGTPVGEGATSVHNDLTVIQEINDFGPAMPAGSCAGQIFMAGLLMYQGDHRNVSVSGLNFNSVIRADVQENGVCPQYGAALLTETATVQGGFRVQGTANMLIQTDPGLKVYGAVANSTTASSGTLDVDLSHKVTQCVGATGQTAQDGGDSDTIILDPTDVTADDAYAGRRLTVTAGACNGQTRMIKTNERGTPYADVVPAFTSCTPDSTTVYNIEGCGGSITSLLQAGTSRLNVERFVGDRPITTSGTILFSPTAMRAQDDVFTIADQGDLTKRIAFDASGITTGTTRTYTGPDASGTLVLTSTDDDVPESGDFTNLTGGRSLTCAAGTCDADAETYTQTKCINIDPDAATTDWLFWRSDQALTLTGIDCIVDAATSVVLTPRECDANGGSCSDIEAAITCAATNTTEAGGSIDNASIDAGDYVRVTRGTKTGSPTQATLCLTYTVND